MLPPQAKHRKRLASGFDERGRFLASDPVGHHHRFVADVFQPVRAHSLEYPIQSEFQALRSAKPVTEPVAEFSQSGEWGAVSEGCRNDAAGGVLVTSLQRRRSTRRLGIDRSKLGQAEKDTCSEKGERSIDENLHSAGPLCVNVFNRV
jgi:hypothetical protein